MSLAQQILATDDRQPVPVEAWGVKLFIVPMSGIERDSYDRELADAKEAGQRLDNFRARFLVRCLVDDQGGRIFTDEHAEALGQKNANTISRLWKIATSINETHATAIDDAAKN